MEDQKLKAYFKFDKSDLSANRHGAFRKSRKESYMAGKAAPSGKKCQRYR
jgi:hypothetical protein